MQIIAGTYRGRKISNSATKAVRPCTGRVKKSIFDTLASRIDFDGIKVLDLFAGFGNLGFESLSRGASHVSFVDSGRDALGCLRETAANLSIQDDCSIISLDVSLFVRQGGGTWDLVFCDPPYAWKDYETLIHAITDGGLLSSGGMLVIEHQKHHDFSHLSPFAFHRDYGMTRVTFFQR